METKENNIRGTVSSIAYGGLTILRTMVMLICISGIFANRRPHIVWLLLIAAIILSPIIPGIFKRRKENKKKVVASIVTFFVGFIIMIVSMFILSGLNIDEREVLSMVTKDVNNSIPGEVNIDDYKITDQHKNASTINAKITVSFSATIKDKRERHNWCYEVKYDRLEDIYGITPYTRDGEKVDLKKLYGAHKVETGSAENK
ncbi:hypothetical protein [Eubacterium xylanophilum]|uniref:hypothetical protein n=1 Tax=Eubacterium xylanophilum TaxID=39497 RepID=UPI00047AC918|nr:hypothetical protein [Eubacterium xylanophilum]